MPVNYFGTSYNAPDKLRFWCNKVLPLVYDDSLSYYEVLCKVVKYINDLIEQDKVFGADIEQMKADIKDIQEWIDTVGVDWAVKVVEKIIIDKFATIIFVELDESGHIIFNIPKQWDDLEFRTTGYDYDPHDPTVGENRLVVLY